MLGYRRKEIRRQAENFREGCIRRRYAIVDLFEECERCGYKLVRYPMGEAGNLGFTLRKGTDVIIVTNSSARLSREIFTLAHEIGHVLLHMEKAERFVDDVTTISGKSSEEFEQEANYFAACLLMPEDEVSKFLDVEIENFENGNGLSVMDMARIMSEFNVSFEMALNRLENLEKITFDQRVRIDVERNQTRVGNLLQSVRGKAQLNKPSGERSIPWEYIEYVIYNYNRDAIPVDTLKRVLGYYQLTMEDVRDRLEVHMPEEDDLADWIGGLED